MIPSKYKKKEIESLEILQKFTQKVDDTFFDPDEIKNLTDNQVFSRYKLAKESIGKIILTTIQLDKESKGIGEEEKIILDAILSMNDAEKLKVKEFILNLRK